MYFIAIAPVLGHVFSPFLNFKGGKAIAVFFFGVWIGLTIWKASLAGVLGTVIGISLITSSGWAVMLGLAWILVTLLIWIPYLAAFCVGESNPHPDLDSPIGSGHKPHLRPWLVKRRPPHKS